MAKKKNGVLDLIPQLGDAVHSWYSAPLYPEGPARKYPTKLRVFDILSKKVTEVKAMNDECTVVLVNNRWTAKAERSMNQIYKSGDIIVDEEAALEIRNAKYDAELRRSRYIIEELEERLAAAKDDDRKLNEWATLARNQKSLDLDKSGDTFIITDRKLSADDIQELIDNPSYTDED
jgi:hypothetical protein